MFPIESPSLGGIPHFQADHIYRWVVEVSRSPTAPDTVPSRCSKVVHISSRTNWCLGGRGRPWGFSQQIWVLNIYIYTYTYDSQHYTLWSFNVVNWNITIMNG